MLKRMLKKIIDSNKFSRSIAATIANKSFTLVTKDSDGDYIITNKGSKLVSSNPQARACAEDMELFTFGYKCKKGDTVVICGVDEGHELEHFCTACAPGKVIAIECTPSCIRKLKKLKRLNSLSNLEIVDCAAGEKEESLFLKEGELSSCN